MTQSRGAAPVAVISGVGPRLGSSLCRRLIRAGFRVAGLARSEDHGRQLERELSGSATPFRFLPCDITDEAALKPTLSKLVEDWAPPSVLVHNARQLLIKPFVELTAAEFEAMWRVTALGAMLTTKAIVPGMKARGGGTIIFTGATAGMRGGARFSAFASAEFALRGLAQSLAREHGPAGIHVVHAILDGVTWGGVSRSLVDATRETCIEPDAVAESYLQLIRQDKSAWTHEIDLRPSVESF